MPDGPAGKLEKYLQGRELDGYTLQLRDYKEGRTGRETYFNMFVSRRGSSSVRPIVQGLYFMGRGKDIRAWIEFRYTPRADFEDGDGADLEEEGLTSRLISMLAELIPAGGSMMVIYGAESHPLLAETEKGLKRDFPPAATPLGSHLWENGFRWFKDWYFPEGWMEGGMKLQATLPLDDGIRREREEKAAADMKKFVASLRGNAVTRLEEQALSRAEGILSTLEE